MLHLLLFRFYQTRTEKKCLLETVPWRPLWKGCGGVLNASSTAKTNRVAFQFGTICLGFTGSHKYSPAMLLLAECIVPNVRDLKVILGREKKEKGSRLKFLVLMVLLRWKFRSYTVQYIEGTVFTTKMPRDRVYNYVYPHLLSL